MKQYDENPIFLSSMAIIQYVPCCPYCHWEGHRKIEPKAKHFSHCKKNQSSWPDQIDSSKRLAKISNHAYKNSEKIQIIFIDKLIINPQFIGSRQTHRKRRLQKEGDSLTSTRCINGLWRCPSIDINVSE